MRKKVICTIRLIKKGEVFRYEAMRPCDTFQDPKASEFINRVLDKLDELF